MKFFKSPWMWLIASIITSSIGWDGWAWIFFIIFIIYFTFYKYRYLVELIDGQTIIANKDMCRTSDIILAQENTKKICLSQLSTTRKQYMLSQK